MAAAIIIIVKEFMHPLPNDPPELTPLLLQGESLPWMVPVQTQVEPHGR